MKRIYSLSFCIACMAFSILAQSCGSVNKTQKGTALGSAAGGAIGALIGKKAGNPVIGATIGAALGGSTGAFIGSKLSRGDSTVRKPGTISSVKENAIVKVDIARPEDIDNSRAISKIASDSISVERPKAAVDAKSPNTQSNR